MQKYKLFAKVGNYSKFCTMFCSDEYDAYNEAFKQACELYCSVVDVNKVVAEYRAEFEGRTDDTEIILNDMEDRIKYKAILIDECN